MRIFRRVNIKKDYIKESYILMCLIPKKNIFNVCLRN